MDSREGLCATTHKSYTVNSSTFSSSYCSFLQDTHALTFFRCGLTLTISTNLVVWMAAVAEESVHQTEVPALNISYKTYRGTCAKIQYDVLVKNLKVFPLQPATVIKRVSAATQRVTPSKRPSTTCTHSTSSTASSPQLWPTSCGKTLAAWRRITAITA